MCVSVYFTEDEGRRHVIGATDGLSSSVIGQVHGLWRRRGGADRRVPTPLNLEQIPTDLTRSSCRRLAKGSTVAF